MKVWLNDESIELPESLSLKEALEIWSYADKTIAVAINQYFIPSNQHASTFIQPNDRLDIVSPMQGG
jgi:sulfur carrier protein